jgi:hypothetical protein
MSGEFPTDPGPEVSVAAEYDYPHLAMIARTSTAPR